MKHLGTKVLLTPRLRLRPFEEGDCYAVYGGWMGREDTTRYLSVPRHESLGFTRSILEVWRDAYRTGREYNWCVALRETGRPVGAVTLNYCGQGDTAMSLGYVVAWDCQGRGIATP